ncbi:hypothetical protein RD110_07570 [Rhodoferax koreense]|uniref:EF-hand domain-containing protein n=1 Tax=Rhodoferax koreensis TaxID=1842727 RepID=A0A1P8JTN5_9BURK|nr:hypothetical protein RD110_07570 [Rhodoferax koreense]
MSCLLLLLVQAPAWAHKGSDAYLDVQTTGVADTAALKLTLAIAIKDLDLLVPLDANADGQVTWGEIKAALPAMHDLLQASTGIEGDAAPGAPACHLAWSYAGLERRSDGTYIRFASDTACRGATSFRYRLLREQDATHRLLVTGMVDGQALLSTWSATAPGALSIRHAKPEGGAPVAAGAHTGPATLWAYLNLGVHHLLEGYDHLAFLLALVLPLRLALGRRAPRETDLQAARHAANWWALLRTVTAFTVGHSITLILATLGLTSASPAWVEPAIAVTIAITALLNIFPVRHVRTDVLALLFGMVHGYGFASLLTEAAAPAGLLPWALAGFNLGVECGQLLAVAGWVLMSQVVQRQPWHGRVVVRGGSWLLVLVAAFWFWERVR